MGSLFDSGSDEAYETAAAETAKPTTPAPATAKSIEGVDETGVKKKKQHGKGAFGINDTWLRNLDSDAGSGKKSLGE